MTNQIFFPICFSFVCSFDYFGSLFFTEPKEFQILLKRLGAALKEQNLLFTTSCSVTLQLTSMEFHISQYVDIFDLIHINLDIADILQRFSFAYVQNEIKPSNIKRKMKNLIEWGIPPSKLVRPKSIDK